MRQGRR